MSAEGCGHCGRPVPASSPSPDFCDERCQHRFHAARAVPDTPETDGSRAPHLLTINEERFFLPATRWCPSCGRRAPAPPTRVTGLCTACEAPLPSMTYEIWRHLDGQVVLMLRWGQRWRRAVLHWQVLRPEEAATYFDALEEAMVREARERASRRLAADRAGFLARLRLQMRGATPVHDARRVLRNLDVS